MQIWICFTLISCASAQWYPSASTFVNNLDGPVDFTCPFGTALAGVDSVHSNSREDREFRFKCSPFPMYTGLKETVQANTAYRGSFTVPSSGRRVMIGSRSNHVNNAEDRIFHFPETFITSPFQSFGTCIDSVANGLDQRNLVECNSGSFFTQLISTYGSGSNDRTYSWQCCPVTTSLCATRCRLPCTYDSANGCSSCVSPLQYVQVNGGGMCLCPDNTIDIGRVEVFAVGSGYIYSRAQAASTCASQGAELATIFQVQVAFQNGADWCFSGWVSDFDQAIYPAATARTGCASVPGVQIFTPTNSMAGVICYGVKPPRGTSGIHNFASNFWSIFDKNGVFDSNRNATCQACPIGTAPNTDKSSCVAIDVCRTSDPCGYDSQCSLLPSEPGLLSDVKYVCTCPPGFTFTQANDAFRYIRSNGTASLQCGAPLFELRVSDLTMCQNLCSSADDCYFATLIPDSGAGLTDLFQYKCQGCSVAPTVSGGSALITYIKSRAVLTTGPTEVFSIGDYVYTHPSAATACANLGARLATTQELQLAQQKGADWCKAGWVSDGTSPIFPTAISQLGCGVAGVNSYLPPSGLASANCFGVKPLQKAVDSIMPWSMRPIEVWSLYSIAGPQEVFAVDGNYIYTLTQAASVCQSYGARVATVAEITRAQQAGAEWCHCAWTADGGAYYPMQTTRAGGGCGSAGINYCGYPALSSVNCYGVKQTAGPGVRWWNSRQWSVFSTASTYPMAMLTSVKNGRACVGKPLPITSRSIQVSNHAIEFNLNTDRQQQGPTSPLFSFSRFQVDVQLYSRGRNTADSVEGYPRKLDGSSLTETASGLIPGALYKVLVTPQDTNNSLLTVLAQKIDVEVNCGCLKSVIGSSEEETGAPASFTAVQNLGVVRFTWTDMSLCEEGFSFYRQNGTGRTSFTEAYDYASEVKCFNQNSPESVGDNLAVSKLPVGSTQTYCVQAISHGTIEPYRSAPVCTPVVVLWEAVIIGNVNLSPSSGSLGVPGVTITWAIRNIGGTVLTDSNGAYRIHMKSNVLVDISQLITLTPSKVDGSVVHQFQCDTFNCTQKVMEIKHLDFKMSYDFVDSTTVPFTGTVYVKGTGSNGLVGCPLKDVHVCLVDHGNPSSRLACTSTDFAGRYTLPAVIGMRVRVLAVGMIGHVFQRVPALIGSLGMTASSAPTDTTPAEFYDITATKVWQQIDLWDVNEERVSIQLVGGKCNRTLGNATFRLTFQECMTWAPQVSLTDVNTDFFSVPAQELNVKLMSVMRGTQELVDVPVFLDNMLTRTQIIDLSNLTNTSQCPVTISQLGFDYTAGWTQVANGTAKDDQGCSDLCLTYPSCVYWSRNSISSLCLLSSTTPSNWTKSTKNAGPRCTMTGNPRLVRFEYHPLPVLSIKFSPVSPSCSNGNPSLVLKADSEVKATIKVVEIFASGIANCDWVPGNLTITNNLGETNATINAMIETNNPKYTSTQMELLTVCNTGCVRDIEMDDLTTGPKNAHVDIQLMTGAPETNAGITDPDKGPNVMAPYSKTMEISMRPVGRSTSIVLRPRVVVTGTIVGEKLQSIVIPEYMPLMVVHDPPGGKSFAEYHQMKSNIVITTATNIKFAGLETELTTEVGGKVSLAISNCYGLGAMACISSGNMAVETKNTAAASTNIEFQNDKESVVESSGIFTLQFSYITSTEPKDAGMMSDMYLSPTLNILFCTATSISFNYTACTGVSTSVQVWQLGKGDGNKQVFSWLSHRDIQEREIPKLRLLLEQELAKTTPDTNKIAELNKGLVGWTKTLNHTVELYNKAKMPGLLPPATAYARNSGYPRYSGLVPQNLIAGGVPLPNTTMNNNDLEAISAFKFTGGGAELSYSINMAQIQRTASANQDEFKQKGGVGFNVGFDLFGVDGSFAANIQPGGGFNTRSEQGAETESDQSVSFTLGDPDVGDEFSVDVVIDPTYKTFMFNTFAGMSKCPVEPNTIAREKPRLTLDSSPLALPAPNFPSVYKVRLMNDANESATSMFYVNAESNPDNLDIRVDGSPIGNPIKYNIAGNNAVTLTISIFRGPLKYTYFPITIGLMSECDNDLKAELNLPVSFLQPCPLALFAGTLLEANTFVVNKTDSLKTIGPNLVRVVVSNPQSFSRSWASESRLLKVYARYRAVSTEEWFECRNSSGLVLNFIPVESSLGYATLNWDVGSLTDGYYEIQLHTVCSPSGSDAPGMEEYQSKVITGLIDRVSPAQFGGVEPINGKYFPGATVAVSFSEKVQCSAPFRFMVDLVVQGVTQIFNKNNMLIVCEQRKISITFTALQSYIDLMGKTASLSVNEVTDLARNPQHRPVVANLTFQAITAAAALVEVDALHLTTPNGEQPKHADLQKELASLLQMSDRNRIEVRGTHRPDPLSNYVLVDITIKPESTADIDFFAEEESGLTKHRVRSKKVTKSYQQTPLHLVKNLYVLVEEHAAWKKKKSVELLDDEDNVSFIQASNRLSIMKNVDLPQGTFITRIQPCNADIKEYQDSLLQDQFKVEPRSMDVKSSLQIASTASSTNTALLIAILSLGIIFLSVLLHDRCISKKSLL